jgi:hypothetical protein
MSEGFVQTAINIWVIFCIEPLWKIGQRPSFFDASSPCHYKHGDNPSSGFREEVFTLHDSGLNSFLRVVIDEIMVSHMS